MRCVLTASDCWQTANGAPTRASVVSGHTLKQGRRHAPYATAVGGFQGLQALSLHRWPPLGAFIKLPALRVVHDFCLPHTSLRLPWPHSEATHGTGTAKRWQPRTPAMAAGLTAHVWTLREVLLFRVPPWPQRAGG